MPFLERGNKRDKNNYLYIGSQRECTNFSEQKNYHKDVIISFLYSWSQTLNTSYAVEPLFLKAVLFGVSELQAIGLHIVLVANVLFC